MSLTSIICGIALLTIGEVGPQNMPDTIEPVESPFVMPLFERPVFPESTILVRMEQEGMSTKPIQEAIDSMSCRGGGNGGSSSRCMADRTSYLEESCKSASFGRSGITFQW